MLPKQNRVSEKEVALIFKQAKSTRTPFFIVRYLPIAGFKCAVIAPKTIAKTAVKRNLLRRKWYGAIHLVIKNLSLKGVYVFVLNQEATKATPSERIHALSLFFNKTSL